MTEHVAGLLFSHDKSTVALMQGPFLYAFGGGLIESTNDLFSIGHYFRFGFGETDEPDFHRFATVKDEAKNTVTHYFAAVMDLATIRPINGEYVRRVDVEFLQGHMLAPNLAWLVPMACDNVIADVTQLP